MDPLKSVSGPIVLLDANPLVDIHATSAINTVLLRGSIEDRRASTRCSPTQGEGGALERGGREIIRNQTRQSVALTEGRTCINHHT
jgi:hypothetical protein